MALFTIAACGERAGGDEDGDVGGTIVMVTPANAGAINPLFANDGISRSISDQLYERLAEIGPSLNAVGDGGFEPRLARSWAWARDSLSIAFSIDPGARWHDGQPVRASDVRFTFETARDPSTGSHLASVMRNVDSISVRDSLTAVAWFRGKSPTQFFGLVYNLFVIPEHVLKDVPRNQLSTSEAIRQPVGSGRFRFARSEPGVRVEIIADTGHYRGRAKLDRVIWSFVADPNAAVTQLLGGQADFYEVLPPELVPRVDSHPSLKPVPYPNLQPAFMWMNFRDPRRLTAPHPILADRSVRRAIAMSLDRGAMLTNVFGTRGTLGTGPLAGSTGDTTVQSPPFDRERAQALLDSAGWRAAGGGARSKGGRPLALRLIVPSSSAPRMRYAVLIQEQLRSVGIRVDLDVLQFPAFMNKQRSGDFDLSLQSYGTDPYVGSLRDSWTTRAAPPEGANYIRYSNPTFEALLDSASLSWDAARTRSYARRALQTLADDIPAVWLYEVYSVAGVHRRIQPVGMRADTYWANLADWWIPAGERIERDRIGLQPARP